jgi:hypothetical protein
LEEAKPLPYGDELVKLLRLIIKVLLNHVHPYQGVKADTFAGDTSILDLVNYNLDDILSKNHKIN